VILKTYQTEALDWLEAFFQLDVVRIKAGA